ncbi:winged helix-turn-helix transcriptional regulator [Winogradskya humida]|nr:helix-turn-helix domain-containing protein [Actinoplanes humidus]
MGRTKYLASMAECPTHRLLQRLGGRWVCLVLKELAAGPLHRGELGRVIAGATPKMLTETLRTLERDDLISRTVHEGVPPRVEYALTPRGSSLMPVIAAATEWAERNLTR